jgi:UDP-GlcNAc:undecaprenyl-phosphate GlcNAc-1-phosphate transferase
MNVQLVLTGLFGFFWGGFVTPLSIQLAHSFRIIDLPNARKVHTYRTPRGAGLTLWSGYLLWSLYFVSETPGIRYGATAATLIFFCGYMDDIRSLSPFVRLAGHALAAALIVVPLRLPLVSAVVCLVWITGLTSAYNLIDGLDGLCVSIFIASALTLCCLGDPVFGIAGAGMALGVLCWNFPKASTFLGDGGSTLLGFLFSSHFVTAAAPLFSASASAGRTVWPHELILLFLLLGGIPVSDTLFAFSRRILEGKSPFYPDKGHLHHLLMKKIRSPFWTVACLVLLHALFLCAGAAVYAKLASNEILRGRGADGDRAAAEWDRAAAEWAPPLRS